MKVVANGVYTAKLDTKSLTKAKERVTGAEGRRRGEYECECTIVQCTIQRVQPDRCHHCGSKNNKKYKSTSLLTDSSWFIYRYCTE